MLLAEEKGTLSSIHKLNLVCELCRIADTCMGNSKGGVGSIMHLPILPPSPLPLFLCHCMIIESRGGRKIPGNPKHYDCTCCYQWLWIGEAMHVCMHAYIWDLFFSNLCVYTGPGLLGVMRISVSSDNILTFRLEMVL